jgi:DNA polymerase III subunit alpha
MASMARARPFVHLRLHSAYSLLEGALKIEGLAKRAKADSMVALAITDTNNLFASLEFSEKLAGAGIQPILGCTLTVDFADGETGGEVPDRRGIAGRRGRLALLAKEETGYANLMALSSAAYLDAAETDVPHVSLARIEASAAGLICLTGGPDGPLDAALRDGRQEIAKGRIEYLRRLFGDRLYLEVQRHGLESEAVIEPELMGLAYAAGLPLVATNEPYFAAPEDYEAHDALICIAEGRYVSEDDRRRLTPNHYFKTQAEMADLFADLPEAIDTTIEIARRCAYRPRTRKPILPQFVAKASGDPSGQLGAEASELTAQAEAGLKRRLEIAGPAAGCSNESYAERLAYELSVIIRMQYQGYFLIVADFIKWAKAHDIPVGPGRGSGAGSVVAWALTVTDLDPMRFGLLFERFLNPERVSMPDFDIDFCQERRDEVISYVQQKYGSDRVAQIITFGRLQARVVLRDVGRVLSMPYGQVDRLCKLVPNNPANPVSLTEAVAGEPKLQEARDQEPAVAHLISIAEKLEGLNRNASTHAAGIVIGDRPLVSLVPLYRDPRSSLPATQLNMKWVESAGLVKFDFLGLKTLSVLNRAEQLVRERGQELDIRGIPLNDTKTYELLSRGETIGVFQLESTGMRDSLRKLKPDRFEDIIAMVALYRPGPMDNIPTYINRKHRTEAVLTLHPLLAPILEETYGVIIYQEQVMQIAQVLSGYSLGEADLLRRAMGKKIKAEMAQQESRFIEGAVRNGVEQARARFIFELVDKFAGYGFNKSHAAAYALIAYQTAYLKANHPVEFLAATMTFDMSNTEKLASFAEEARRMGISMLPPAINASGVDFLPEIGGIRYALAALRNVGTGAAASLVEERKGRGVYRGIGDLAQRIDTRIVNKRVVEALASAGALDQLESNRAKLLANADAILGFSIRSAENRAVGQNDLFGAAGPVARQVTAGLQLREVRAWPGIGALEREHEAIGYYLTGHPLDEYAPVLSAMNVETWRNLERRAGAAAEHGVLAGIVINKRERPSRQGGRFAFASFSDQTGQFEAIIFSEALADAGELLEPGAAVLIHVEAKRDGDAVKLRALMIQSLDHAAAQIQRGLTITLDETAGDELASTLVALRTRLRAGGSGEIRLLTRLPDVNRQVELVLAGRYHVTPALARDLQGLEGVRSVHPIWDTEPRVAA